jgi:hypothetical protein
MTKHFDLIVTDASPLITLAAAGALDCLLMLGVPVIIPDMVFTEATRDINKIGAEDIILWVRKHHKQIEVSPTEIFAAYQVVLESNQKRHPKGLGEMAAAEVLSSALDENDDLYAILLYEDNDIRRRNFVMTLPARVTPLSTGDLLYELEITGLIQSSASILDTAAEAGRNVEQLRNTTADETMRQVLRHQLSQPKDPT